MAALKADIWIAWLLYPTLRKGVRGCKNLMAAANLALCASCAGVLGFETVAAIPRIYDMPFQLAPMTVPTLPEKPPKIPCLIVLMIFGLIGLCLDLVWIWYCANTILDRFC